MNEEELGRRMYQMQKEKSVEEALERIRTSIGKYWAEISRADHAVISELLGDAWIRMERKEWERCAFTRLAPKDIEKLLDVGHTLRTGGIDRDAAIGDVVELLKKTYD
ncbi:MAG: hypothetical protein GKC04_01420 [Methanomicrobiales archaeon]|nr:hypothetical protein [Methanomicrobiales archaeon]